LICGGKIFLNEAKRNNCKILPIDSEHHCIDFFYKNFNKKNKIKNIYLTASGGPFLNKKIKFNQNKTSVLNHPNWRMGKKITVDSSTFANKVLELFEAKNLFNLESNKIKIIVEKKSNVHSIIEFDNNIIFQVLHNTNMEIPISNSLNIKNNLRLPLHKLCISLVNPDSKKFPLISLGYNILNNLGDAGMIYFTVFNQRLVESFLNDKIKYGVITKNLVNIFKNDKIIKKSNKKIKNLKDIFNIINDARHIKL